MWNNVLWEDVLNDVSIISFEHPVYECLVDKDEYFKEFKDVLELLNGETMSDFVDFFFKRDRVSRNSLIFIGEDEKQDFYEWAVECNCIPQLKEIHEGESQEDKEKRITEEIISKSKKEMDERSRFIQKEKQKLKKKIIDKELEILESTRNLFEKMLKNQKTKPNKLEKTKLFLKEEYIKYKSKNNVIIESIEIIIN